MLVLGLHNNNKLHTHNLYFGTCVSFTGPYHFAGPYQWTMSSLLTLLSIIHSKATSWREKLILLQIAGVWKLFKKRGGKKLSHPLQEADWEKSQHPSRIIIIYCFQLQSFLPPPNQTSLMIGTLQTILQAQSLLHDTHNWCQRSWKFGTGIVLSFLLRMEKYSKDEWSARGRNGAWILQCQTQCGSKKIFIFLHWISSSVSRVWHLDGILTASEGKKDNQ